MGLCLYALSGPIAVLAVGTLSTRLAHTLRGELAVDIASGRVDHVGLTPMGIGVGKEGGPCRRWPRMVPSHYALSGQARSRPPGDQGGA